ncbi:extracellular solute-binding protein [Devosia sp.]|uniref:extracellular solute-binding protein n=1 Tax=Devosia sp. TaxID=1871048 RepID=UPI002F1FA49E
MRLVVKLLGAAAVLTTALAAEAYAQDCTIRVTTWGGNYQKTYESIAPEFEKQYNCKIEWVVGVSNDFIVRARAGEVDVVTAPMLHAVSGEMEGLWADLDETLIPNLANLYDNARHSKQIVWANVGDYAIVYNSKYIPEAPDSWDDLWDEKYHNRVAMWTIESQMALLLAYQQATAHGGSFDNIEPGLQRLADLVNGGNAFVQSDAESQLVSLFEAEEAWIGPLTTGRIKDLWDRGLDHIEIARPQEGTFPVITALSVVKTSKNMEMAQKFVDFALGETAQRAFAVNNLYAPTNRTVTLPEDFALRDVLVQGDAFDRLIVVDFLKLSEVRSDWQERFQRMLK